VRYVFIYIRFNSLPLQQHRFYLKQHCICNLNILRWNPKQQLRVTLNGYFTIHFNTVNVVAPFRQNVNLCCAVTRSQTKANTTDILGKIVYMIILAPPALTSETTETVLIINFFCELANRLFDLMNSQFSGSAVFSSSTTCLNLLK